jgi:hypothetical protein
VNYDNLDFPSQVSFYGNESVSSEKAEPPWELPSLASRLIFLLLHKKVHCVSNSHNHRLCNIFSHITETIILFQEITHARRKQFKAYSPSSFAFCQTQFVRFEKGKLKIEASSYDVLL